MTSMTARPGSSSGTAYEIVFDGGSLGNPGKGYGSFLIRYGDVELARERVEFEGRVTNNQAEYRTLIHALARLKSTLGPEAASATVQIGGDSQLVINQVNGTWKVKNADLAPLRQQVVEGLRQFGKTSLTWHRRDRSVRELGH
ncbi:MAG TPA: ribonuclease HI family protein [Thermomicrobiales bacterium]|jgi:ribonuclease HI|nr:ribonuclease HI family protein [Thermomicrobiales bacterium]